MFQHSADYRSSAYAVHSDFKHVAFLHSVQHLQCVIDENIRFIARNALVNYLFWRDKLKINHIQHVFRAKHVHSLRLSVEGEIGFAPNHFGCRLNSVRLRDLFNVHVRLNVGEKRHILKLVDIRGEYSRRQRVGHKQHHRNRHPHRKHGDGA